MEPPIGAHHVMKRRLIHIEATSLPSLPGGATGFPPHGSSFPEYVQRYADEHGLRSLTQVPWGLTTWLSMELPAHPEERRVSMLAFNESEHCEAGALQLDLVVFAMASVEHTPPQIEQAFAFAEECAAAAMRSALQCYQRDELWAKFVRTSRMECDLFSDEEELRSFMNLLVSQPLTDFDDTLPSLLALHEYNSVEMVRELTTNFYAFHVRHVALPASDLEHYFLLSSTHEQVMLHIELPKAGARPSIHVCHRGHERELEARQFAVSQLINSILHWMWRRMLAPASASEQRAGT